jgi:hypothetical protein
MPLKNLEICTVSNIVLLVEYTPYTGSGKSLITSLRKLGILL